MGALEHGEFYQSPFSVLVHGVEDFDIKLVLANSSRSFGLLVFLLHGVLRQLEISV